MAKTGTSGLSPYAGAVSLGQSFWRGRSGLSGDKQSYRCADQNQKSRKGRHNAYLFKDGHDPPPDANAYTGEQEQRSRTAEVAVRLPTQGVEILGTGREGENERGRLSWRPLGGSILLFCFCFALLAHGSLGGSRSSIGTHA